MFFLQPLRLVNNLELSSVNVRTSLINFSVKPILPSWDESNLFMVILSKYYQITFYKIIFKVFTSVFMRKIALRFFLFVLSLSEYNIHVCIASISQTVSLFPPNKTFQIIFPNHSLMKIQYYRYSVFQSVYCRHICSLNIKRVRFLLLLPPPPLTNFCYLGRDFVALRMNAWSSLKNGLDSTPSFSRWLLFLFK